MTAPEDTVADALELLLRTIPGVAAVYPSAPLPAVIVGGVLTKTRVVAPPRLVSVSSARGEWRVTAAIGVDENVPAEQTGRAARERIVEYLTSGAASPAGATSPASATLPPRVTVRISMVG
ncbi:hypothetical protein [Subtercola lobariae]|uniref:Uncharacterized protein n=1 Tax=Subtercola lobariae TaxID=1588641 RepID=A0A917AZR3_9MICO|nr:hypothetical protein [Subtercola lobariae]GGF10161.1 hypothetical protein GCM10011399_00030 [Subtercola lobariae]